MNKRILLLIIISALLSSCTSIRFQDLLMLDENQDLTIHGNVTSILCYSEFPEQKKDSNKIVLIYNLKKQLQQQIDYYPKGKIITYFEYDQKGREIGTKNVLGKWSTKQEYDRNGNMVNYKQFNQDTITFEKKIFYDSKNNIVKTIHLSTGKPGDTSVYQNDYKKRIQTIIPLKSKSKIFKYFDKEGRLIQSDSKFGKLEYEYDRNSRICKKTSYKKNGELKFIVTYENQYDKKNNLIETKVLENGKLFKRNVYVIKYN